MEADEHDDTRTQDEVPDRLAEMLAQREIERMARALERDLHVSADDADDAVLDAVVKTLERDEPLGQAKIGFYVFKAARNALVDVHRSRGRFDEAAPDLYDEHDGGRLAEHVVGEAVFHEIRAVVERWDNDNWRAVTLALLDAAYDGEELTYTELAERASAALGKDLSPDSVRVWKSRGIKRLRAEVIDKHPEVDTP